MCPTPGCYLPDGCPHGLARNKYGCITCECAGEYWVKCASVINRGYLPIIKVENAGVKNNLFWMKLFFIIRHLHISHNAPHLPPNTLHNLCFSFLLGITATPWEIENNAYAKFWGANKVHYHKWEMCKRRINIPRRSPVWVLYHSGLRFTKSKGVALSSLCESYKIDRVTQTNFTRHPHAGVITEVA